MVDSAIDAMRDAEGGLDRRSLRSILPYGDDFLFVDQISRLTEEEIEAQYAVPNDSRYIQAHFEDLPIMPGALLGEGLAQAGTLLVRYNLEDHRRMHVLAFQIDDARFLSPARPGDQIDYRVQLLRLRRHVARLEGQAHVGERLVCTARFVLAIVERETLRQELEAIEAS